MTDSKDLIREIQEHTAAHGGENTSTHLLVQAVLALQRKADELAAIRAGGVSGPLMGKPQAMPDLSQLTERGAVAWAGVDAQGLRDGVASAESEPVAFLVCTEEGDPDMVFLSQHEAQQYLEDDERPTPLYTHPSHPEGMVGGWMPIATAPKDGTRFVAVGNNYGLYSETQHTCIAQWFRGCWMELSDWNEASELKYLTHWMPLPPPPTSAEVVEHG